MYDEKMLSALKNADNFMLCAHIYPDGDALGSLLATGRLLRKMGKNCTMVLHDAVPKRYLCLPDAELIKRPAEIAGMHFDAALAVDVSDDKRMGDVLPVFQAAPLTFEIDHHPTNPCFAQYSFVDAQAAATGELITALWEELGQKLDADAAYQLYCAINSDSGNFCYNSVRAYTFACMQKLMDAGLDIAGAARELFMTRSRAHAAALGKALSSMKYFADGEATCMHLSQADKDACQAEDADIGGIVNYGLYLDGVRMTFMIDEGPEGWKVSLRALPGGDVSRIATQFGGGGHVLAAGCCIPGSCEDVEQKLMAAIEEALRA